MSAVDEVHETVVKAESDIRGLVFYARCSCGWRGPNHPSIPTVAEASQRATSDAAEHRDAAEREAARLS